MDRDWYLESFDWVFRRFFIAMEIIVRVLIVSHLSSCEHEHESEWINMDVKMIRQLLQSNTTIYINLYIHMEHQRTTRMIFTHEFEKCRHDYFQVHRVSRPWINVILPLPLLGRRRCLLLPINYYEYYILLRMKIALSIENSNAQMLLHIHPEQTFIGDLWNVIN